VQAETELDTAIRVALAAADANAGQTVSEVELLGLVLKFANEGAISGALLYVPGVQVPRSLVKAGMTSLVIAGDATDGQGKRLDGPFIRLRDQARKDLAAISGHKLTSARLTEIQKQAGRMVLIPRYSGRNQDGVRYHHLPESLAPVIAYALVLLVNAKPADGVAQCRLPGCTAFYLRRGRPKRAIYCTDEHATHARKSAGAERQERYRNKPTAKHK
jgi:predicted RNA-binding Zn ribbon-like protein